MALERVLQTKPCARGPSQDSEARPVWHSGLDQSVAAEPKPPGHLPWERDSGTFLSHLETTYVSLTA